MDAKELNQFNIDILKVEQDLIFISSDFIEPERITKERAEVNKLKIESILNKLELIRLKINKGFEK